MPYSNYLANALLGHEFGKSTYTPPATYYLALCKTEPSASDTGSTITEVAYTNYVRKSFTNTSLGAVSAETIASNADITFAAPGTNGDTANGWALLDASSAGNMLRFGAISPALVIVANGSAPVILSGTLTFLVDTSP